MKSVMAALALAALLSGCASQDESGNAAPAKVWPHYVDLPDGRTVLCVWEKSGYGGGPSCDWGTAR